MFRVRASANLRCPRCNIRYRLIAGSSNPEKELRDGSLFLCTSCAAPIQVRGRNIYLMTPGEVFEVLMSPAGDSFRAMWNVVQAAVKLNNRMRV